MKWMIASDIHGSAWYCRALLDDFEAEGASRLILLGDLLYHGPRNDLPRDYSPREVAAMLNARSASLLCVRGNCEAEVDQAVLDFPVMADYAVLCAGGACVYATHGHRFNDACPPPLAKGDSLLCGHTHVPVRRACAGFTYLNPGSVSIPKEDTPHSYLLWEDGEAFTWKEIGTRAAFAPRG